MRINFKLVYKRYVVPMIADFLTLYSDTFNYCIRVPVFDLRKIIIEELFLMKLIFNTMCDSRNDL